MERKYQRIGIELLDEQMSTPFVSCDLTIHKNGKAVTIPAKQIDNDEETEWLIATHRPNGKELGV